MRAKHLSLILAAGIAGFSLAGGPWPGGERPAARAARNAAPPPSNRVPVTLRLRRAAEPREQAFTILVPEGWRTEGGIVRIDPTAGGGAGNAIDAKLDFTVRDPAGRAMIRWLPDMNYVDLRAAPVAPLFPPGSNYNGMRVFPAMDAPGFLLRMAFPYAHPRARGVQVVEQKPLPELAASLAAALRMLPGAAGVTQDAARITVTYEENGVRYREHLAGGVQNLGPLAAGMWANKQVILARAPEAEFAAAARILALVHNSVVINVPWLVGEARGQMERAGIALRTQQQIQEIERAIVEHRQKTNAEIQNDMYLSLTGQEEFINPHTREVERRSNEWRYRWVAPDGSEVYDNREDYDPNLDPVLQRTGFRRSPVRPR